MLESLFNTVAGLKAYHFIKKRLQHKRFHMNNEKFSRTTILNSFFYRTPLVAVSESTLPIKI